MEKTEAFEMLEALTASSKHISPRTQPKSPASFLVRRLLLIVFAVLSLAYAIGFYPAHGTRLTEFARLTYSGRNKDEYRNAFDWSTIQPSKHLVFYPCFDALFCANLIVPLDWSNTSNPASVTLAIAKLPAPVSIDHPLYGGPVLVNPGGPGGSGVGMVMLLGQALQTVVNPDKAPDEQRANSSARYHDILSFDPRGIGLSSPKPQCLSSDEERFSWFLRYFTAGHIDSSDTALGQFWAMAHAHWPTCGRSNANEITRFMTTPLVARDMLAIVDKHQEWRQNQPSKAGKFNTTQERPDKLKFWGLSYGTVIGATFATLFPDRVERLALDGVVDLEDYYEGKRIKHVDDTEAVLQQFYELCAKAGPEKCAMALTNSTTARDIKSNVETILKDIRQTPLAYGGEFAEIITNSDLKDLIFVSLYAPLQSFESLAGILSEITNNQTSKLAQPLHAIHHYDRNNHVLLDATISALTSQTVVLCSDGLSLANATLQDTQHRWKELSKISPTSGAMIAQISLRCTGMPLHLQPNPSAQFRSPYGRNVFNPILWLSNRLDPITPLGNAVKMSALFPGSSVLIQDGVGHCTISGVSICTLKNVRAYFQSGELPRNGTVCSVDMQPFGGRPDLTSLSAGDADLFRRSMELSRWSLSAPFALGKGATSIVREGTLV